MLGLASLISACGSSVGDPSGTGSGTPVRTALEIDTTCDLAAPPSAEFLSCEQVNHARTLEANLEQLSPAFTQRQLAQSAANAAFIVQRFVDDPSWGLPPALLNTPATPLCAAGMGPCVGDPFRYPEVDGADGRLFYEQEAEVIPVVYYDRECARISGRVWKPRSAQGPLPAVVIKNGSVQAGEQLYWSAAQALVRAGYLVLTNDPRGQGRSDFGSPTGGQGGNINGAVFFEGLVDDLDFLLSSPVTPYPHEGRCAGTYPTQTDAFNPMSAAIDPDRIGITGHSYGAAGVTWVQSYGAADGDPWPGLLTVENPVKVIVAWDALGSADVPLAATVSSLQSLGDTSFISAASLPGGAPPVRARVPALGFTSEYGFTPVPFLNKPERSDHLRGFEQWRAAGMDVMQLTIAGSTHLDYSLGPVLPATSWCAEVIDNHCVGGWAAPMIQHYTVAWFDRWLKQAGEAGFESADARLLDDAQWIDRMSIHYASGRAFRLRSGQQVDCADIRLECPGG